MTIVYALLYDIGDGAAEISGIYATLKTAKNAIGVIEWKEFDDPIGAWEGFDPEGNMWYIEAHALQ
jgi:hypothetical protein